MIKICSETVCQDCLMKKNCINKACVFNLNSFPSKSSRRHRQGKSQTRNLSKTRRFGLRIEKSRLLIGAFADFDFAI